VPIPDPKEPLRAYLKIQRIYDAEVRTIMEQAARSIQARIARLPAGVGGQIRAAQLRLVLSEIDAVMVQAWGKGVLPSTQRGRKAAAEAAQRATETITNVLYTGLPDQVAETVRDGLRLTAQAGIEADYARVPRELSQRVYRDAALSSGQVEQTIRAGLISGLSARELAADVYHLVSPTAPGGPSYAAMRLARTEINNAFHEQQKKGAERPGVLAAKWNLSGSHPKPDQCNVYAEQDADDLGPGLYKAGNIPDKPHPNCLCFLTYETMDNAQFEKALKNGQFDDELDRRTKANLERLGIKELPKAPVDKPKVTVKTVKPSVKKTSSAPKKPPVKKIPPPSRTPGLDKLPRLKPGPSRLADMRRDIKATNPGYGSPGYNVNCTHVVNTFELRARGYDVEASRLPKELMAQGGRHPQEVIRRWTLPDGSPHHRSILPTLTGPEMKRLAEALPEGARAWVRVSWDKRYGGGGHIFNVEMTEGRLRWIEAQKGRSIKIEDYMVRAAGGDQGYTWGIVRVDDLAPTDQVLEFVEEG
jgi:hypothetical protein